MAYLETSLKDAQAQHQEAQKQNQKLQRELAKREEQLAVKQQRIENLQANLREQAEKAERELETARRNAQSQPQRRVVRRRSARTMEGAEQRPTTVRGGGTATVSAGPGGRMSTDREGFWESQSSTGSGGARPTRQSEASAAPAASSDNPLAVEFV